MKSCSVIKQKLAPLKKYLDRDDIVEICVNKPGEVLLETLTGEWQYYTDKKITKDSIQQLGEILANNSGDEFSFEHPIYAGRLPEYGYRIQLNMFSHVESGISMAIRVAQAQKFELESYMPPENAAMLKNFVIDGKTMLICAGTGCGKTTFLNSLLAHIPKDKRVLTIEDTRELVVPHENSVSYVVSKSGTDVAQLGYKQMIDSALRQRPDRILLGEITVDNVMPFLNIANSGHSGSISTLHAKNPVEAVNKLCTNAMVSGVQASKSDIREFVKDCVDVYVMIEKKIENGKRIFSARFEETLRD